jgi:hypothetical protein
MSGLRTVLGTKVVASIDTIRSALCRSVPLVRLRHGLGWVPARRAGLYQCLLLPTVDRFNRNSGSPNRM